MTRLPLALLIALLIGFSASADVIKTVTAGAADQTVTLRIIDSTDGTPETGVVFNTAGIDLEYWRHGANAAVDITEATQTVNGAHTDGGFVHIGHGVYRLDLPDAAVASGVTAVDVYGTVTGMIVLGGTVQLSTDTPQTGDAFARLGAPIGASISADLQVIDTNVDDVETDTADMQPKLGTFPNLGSGTTLAGNLEDMRDNGTAVFDRATDSLQAIRDRGDAAWTTGGAGSDPSIQSTTVASVTSQTILVPTATPTFIDQINGWAVYLEDAGDADAYHLTTVTDYNQTNGEVTIAEAAPFTVAAADTMVFLPAFMDLGVDVTAWNGTALATTNPLPNAAPSGSGGLPTVDANNRIVGVQVLDEDTTTIDLNATAFGSAVSVATVGSIATGGITSGSFAAGAINAAAIGTGAIDADALAADAGTELGTATWATTTRLLTAGTNIVLAKGTGVTGFNDLSAAQVNTEVDTALTDIHLDHLLAADYDPAAKPGVATALLNELVESDAGVSRFTANSLEQAPTGTGESLAAIADAVWDELLSGHAGAGSAGEALTSAAAGGGLDAAGVRAAVGLASANLDTQLGDIPTVSEFNARTVTSATYATATALQTVDDNVDAVLADTAEIGVAGAGLAALPWNAAWDAQVQSEVEDGINLALEQSVRSDAAILNCEVNTANFAGSTTTVACILTDRDGGAITAASGDLEGRELLVLSGAQIYEGRFINDTTWDSGTNELRLTLSRALPGTLADAVTAIIR